MNQAAAIHPDLAPTLAQLVAEAQRAAARRAEAVAQTLSALAPDAPSRHAIGIASAVARLHAAIAVYQQHIDDARTLPYSGSAADIVTLSHEITLCRATIAALLASPTPFPRTEE